MKRAKAKKGQRYIVNVFDGRSVVIDDQVREYDDDIFKIYENVLELVDEPKTKQPAKAKDTKNIEVK